MSSQHSAEVDDIIFVNIVFGLLFYMFELNPFILNKIHAFEHTGCSSINYNVDCLHFFIGL